MGFKPAAGLQHELIQSSQHPEIRIPRVIIIGEGEMKTTAMPAIVGGIDTFGRDSQQHETKS
jgi:hypothetical protein